jgi:hypothetical protein
LSNVPPYTLNRNIKSDLCSRAGVTTENQRTFKYTVVQSSGRVVERYRGKPERICRQQRHQRRTTDLEIKARQKKSSAPHGGKTRGKRTKIKIEKKKRELERCCERFRHCAQ